MDCVHSGIKSALIINGNVFLGQVLVVLTRIIIHMKIQTIPIEYRTHHCPLLLAIHHTHKCMEQCSNPQFWIQQGLRHSEKIGTTTQETHR